uniref:Uncharacterized protein n=1 Tax=Zea mays TaxID=4577 RepID=A0A804NP20_MAIZE
MHHHCPRAKSTAVDSSSPARRPAGHLGLYLAAITAITISLTFHTRSPLRIAEAPPLHALHCPLQYSTPPKRTLPARSRGGGDAGRRGGRGRQGRENGAARGAAAARGGGQAAGVGVVTAALPRHRARHAGASRPLRRALPVHALPLIQPLRSARVRRLVLAVAALAPEPAGLEAGVALERRVGAGGAAQRRAAAGRGAVGAGHGRGGLRGRALLAGAPRARRRRRRPRQLQRLLRPVPEARAAAAAGVPRRGGGGRRRQRRGAAGAAARVGALHARAAPGRAGRRAARDAGAAGVRGLQRGRPRRPLRGRGKARRPAAGGRVGVVVVGVRAQHPGALLRGAPHGPPRVAVRGHQEGRRGHRARVQPHLRALHHRPPLLHRVRAVGPPRHGLLLLRPQHRRRRARHAVPRRRRLRRAPRLHLHRRRRQGLPRRARHGRQEHGLQVRPQARARAAPRVQPRQHLAGARHPHGRHPREAPGQEGDQARRHDASQRGRAVHARQCQPRRARLRLPPRHLARGRPPPFRRLVRQVLQGRRQGRECPRRQDRQEEIHGHVLSIVRSRRRCV